MNPGTLAPFSAGLRRELSRTLAEKGTGMGLLRKGFIFWKGETFKKPHASAPEEPFLKYYGALHLLNSMSELFLQILPVRCTWFQLR